MKAKDVAELFGGQSALAKLLGIGQSTVAYWVKTGVVPAKWHRALLGFAINKGVRLSPGDLVELPEAIPVEENTESVAQAPERPEEAPPGPESSFLFYASNNGTVKVQVMLGDETVWASQRGMSEIFGADVSTISYHLKNIYESGELLKEATIGKFPLVQIEGGRQVRRENVEFYNLDAIISVGYRVNSGQATQFRKWATRVLKEYLIKGFALDDDRLKQGNELFGKDYFDELLERIREIRASERRFYQKITDIYAQCSIDYDKDSPISQHFYANVQDKLHFAIHGKTSAELINARADATKPNMGLTSYKNVKSGGKVTKLDVTVGKNYLSEVEISDLNRLVSMFLDFAENFARRKVALKMSDWASKLDSFLEFNAYAVLEGYGGVRRESAEQLAVKEYEKFRVIQDRKFKSDFDEIVDKVRTNKALPKPKRGDSGG